MPLCIEMGFFDNPLIFQFIHILKDWGLLHIFKVCEMEFHFMKEVFPHNGSLFHMFYRLIPHVYIYGTRGRWQFCKFIHLPIAPVPSPGATLYK